MQATAERLWKKKLTAKCKTKEMKYEKNIDALTK